MAPWPAAVGETAQIIGSGTIDEPGCASLVDGRGMLARAVAGENFPKVRQPKVRSVLLDKGVDTISPVAVTVGALDFQHRDSVGDIPESDRAAIAHRPAGGSSLSLSSLARSRFSRLKRASGPGPVPFCSRSI